jgi:putative endopeptidase
MLREMAVGCLVVVSAQADTPAARADTAKTAARPVRGAWGVDVSGMDRTVKPGDDFFAFANGHWLRTAEIPADKTVWGSFEVLRENAEQNVRALIDELGASREPLAAPARKIVDFTAAFDNQAAIDAAGLAPAKPALDAIAAASTHADIARLMARADLALESPFKLAINLDQKNPDRYVTTLTHAGLGMPDREYYLSEDTKFAELRAQYRAHLERFLTLAGFPTPAAGAATIIDLETGIARLHWPRAKRRERDLTYNPRSPGELATLAPDFPWASAMETAGLARQSTLIVRELDTMAPLAALFRHTRVEDWRTYLSYHYLRALAPALPAPFDAEVFDFYGRMLNGQPQLRERRKRAVAAVNGALGEAVGELYVARHFPPESKASMEALVENVRKAYARRIDGLDWMTPETKAAAREKLAAFRAKIAYPARWRDYSGLEVRANDAFGNAVRSRTFDWQRDLARLDKPSDRDEWRMTPQTVNAYYNATFNEIVFPAAILQPPFFDPRADAAVNYGGIGGVIGHEMGHGFDDQGSKSDARGILRSWWNARDDAAFRARVDSLDQQYSGFVPLPGLKVNGRLTLGENIGDLGGLSVALEAYRISLDGKSAPVIDGFTGEQRFFLGWAQVWRSKYREASLRNLVMTNPHSPPEFRVNGVVRNIDAWYQAFGVDPGDKLYLATKERVRIW